MSDFKYTVNASRHTFKFTEIGNLIYVNTTMVLPTDNDISLMWIQQIEEIQGVIIVEFSSKYELNIHKGECFETREIADQVVNILVKNMDDLTKTQEETVFQCTVYFDSGEKFQVTEIPNDSLGKTVAWLDTTLILPEGFGTEPVISLSKKIENIRGVVKITFINKYRLHIDKGICFEWKDIVPQVVKCLLENLSGNSPCLSAPMVNAVENDTEGSSVLDFFSKLAEIENGEPLFKGVK
jgi:hypothetical protein